MARRINGEGTVWFVKSENRWRGQFYDLNKKRRTISGKDRKTVEVKLREALTKRDNQTLESTISQAGTVSEALDSFLESKSHREFKTIERYRLDIERYLKPTIGNLKLANLSAEQIEKAYSKIRMNFILENNSMVHVHSTLRGTIKRALKHKKIVGNPLDGIEAPKRTKTVIEPLSRTETQKVLKLADSLDGIWPLLWNITLLTGFRQGEVMGLCWKDINLEEGTLRLHSQLQRQTGKGLVLKGLKSHRSGQVLQLDSRTLGLLKNWKKQQVEIRLKLESWDSRNFVFTNSVGNPMEPRKATKKWAELIKSAGLRHLNLHGARHTFATLLLEEDVDVKYVSFYLGHGNTSTTQNIYQHVSKKALSEVARKIGEIAM